MTKRRVMGITGVRSDRIESILGYGYGPEIVHRNNMALADNGPERDSPDSPDSRGPHESRSDTDVRLPDRTSGSATGR